MMKRTRMLEVRQIENSEAWESFIKSQSNTLFVQSSHYGDFYRAIGENAWILGLYEESQLVGGSLIVSTHAKRGNFLYIPYGPIVDFEQGDHVKKMFDALVLLAKTERCGFLRVSPFIDDTAAHKEVFHQRGFRPAPMHVLAETTWLLDIRPEEEALLAHMNKNHRNLIHRCMNDAVRTEITQDPKKLDGFHALLDETTRRHQFHRFSRRYIDAEFQAFAPHGEAALIQSFLPDGTLDSAAIVMFYGTMACYRHGASLGRDKRLPTSYATQWQAIREAKRRGCTEYNFWGIAEDGAPKSHPFFGITHFKKGFGGRQKNLLHCHDLPLRPSYWVNWGIESLRRIQRGF